MSNGRSLAGVDDLYASAVLDKQANEVIIKIVNSLESGKVVSFKLEGVKNVGREANITILTAISPDAVNSIEKPWAVSPVVKTMAVKRKKMDVTLQGNSFTVIRIPVK